MPPVNDDFASATDLGSATSGEVTFDNTGATIETGEWDDTGAGHSVWFTWTAPDDGTVSFDTADTPAPRWDSYLAAYDGGFARGDQVADDDDGLLQPSVTTADGFGTSLITFVVTSGTTYHIQVGSYDYAADGTNPDAGYPRTDCKLRWSFTPAEITSITPSGGPVGTVVDVNGSGFTSAVGATINGVTQSVSFFNGTHIQVTIQPGTTTGYIVLTLPSVTSPVQFAVGDPPTLDAGIFNETYSGSPAPSLGSAGLAGDVLHLTGNHLDTVTDVFIGGAAASFTSEVVGGDTILHATIPAGAVTGAVAVVNPYGSASRPFTRLYAGPWVQPPSRWVRDYTNADYYYLAWVESTTVDAVPAEPASDFDGTVLTIDSGDPTHRPIVQYTEPLYVARTSSDETTPISLFSNADHLDEWSFGVLETVFVLDVVYEAERFGSALMPATEPTTGELAGTDVYSWQFEPGSLDTGGHRHGEPDPAHPLLLDIDAPVRADDNNDYYYWDNQWRDELVNTDGWGLKPTPVMPFDTAPASPARKYRVFIASSVPDADTIGWQFTLQWVNDNSAPVVAHGDWITFAPTTLEFFDRFVTGDVGNTWDPAVTDPITVRVLRRPVGGGTITVMTTFPVADARDLRTVAATDVLTDVTMEWRYLPTGDYELNPDDPVGRTYRPVKKWYTSGELAAKELLATYTADGDYAVAGETVNVAAYNRDAHLSRGGDVTTPSGTPAPYVTAAENSGDDLFVAQPVLVPFSRLDGDGRLGVVATPKRIREWDWPALPDYHRPSSTTWFTDGDYWQAGAKFIEPFVPAGGDPTIRFAFKHRPPRYRLLYTTPQIKPPQRQYPRDDGLAISTRRSWPPPTSKQYGSRRGPTATYW